MKVSVIVCAYTEKRWDELVEAVQSIQAQSLMPYEIILVIDHNHSLYQRVRNRFPSVVVVENQEQRGLSGARNTGLALAQGEVVAFMDEDAVAEPQWLAYLCPHYTDAKVMGVGGEIIPQWHGGRPPWFPDEFQWVVGCTYRGMPQAAAAVRNLIGCNMSFRRELIQEVGDFRHGIGRIGNRPVGCEETELCIRMHHRWPNRILLYEPKARVRHHVPVSRASWSYFFARCYSEGLSKALVTRFVGAGTGLAAERTYTVQTLPLGVLRGIQDGLVQVNAGGMWRALAIISGLAITTAGYVMGLLTDQLTHLTSIDKVDKIRYHGTDGAANEAAIFQPKRIIEIELSRPLGMVSAEDPNTGQHYKQALALVRLHTKPLDMIELTLEPRGLTEEQCAAQIWRTLGSLITEHLRNDGLPPVNNLTAAGLPLTGEPHCRQTTIAALETAPAANIVIATHNRTESLTHTLDSLLALDYPNFEIIVVDNAPRNTATADLIHQVYSQGGRVRYVREDRPGLAVAHNRGLWEVEAPFVAFTDDDVLVDRYWLAELIQGFAAAPNVGCVTGMIAPAEIETQAQDWTEQFGFKKGFQRRIFDRQLRPTPSPLYPYTAGTFGSGANMAFRTEALRKMGGFDPALGAGSKALGGDDLAAFFGIIAHGYTLVYEPSAIVYHRHRRDYAGLQQQAFGYGAGLTAYLTHTVLERPGRLWELIARLPYGLYFTFSTQSPHNLKKRAGYPKELTARERRGMLYGPFAYLRSRWHTRQLRNIGPVGGSLWPGAPIRD